MQVMSRLHRRVPRPAHATDAKRTAAGVLSLFVRVRILPVVLGGLVQGADAARRRLGTTPRRRMIVSSVVHGTLSPNAINRLLASCA